MSDTLTQVFALEAPKYTSFYFKSFNTPAVQKVPLS